MSGAPALGGRGLAASALAFNALVWGCSWWPFRQLLDRGVHPLLATGIVFLVGASLLAVARPGSVRDAWRHPACWAIALATGLTNGSFNWAVALGPVVRVVLLFYLMPVWTVLLARWLLDERLSPAGAARVVLGLTGAMVVLWQPDAGWPWPTRLAEWLAVFGGMSFAMVNVLLRRHAALPAPTRALAMFGGCAACLLPVAILQWLVDPASAARWAAGWQQDGAAIGMLLIGLMVALLLANLALQYGAARLPANLTSVIMLSEVAFATLSAWWWDGERLTPRVVIGGVLILGSAVLAALGDAATRRSARAARTERPGHPH